MMFLAYAMPLASWIVFIYVQHHYGDRPTTHNWWALMTALGTFEYCKAIYALFVPEMAVILAIATAFIAGGLVQVAYERADWKAETEEELAGAH